MEPRGVQRIVGPALLGLVLGGCVPEVPLDQARCPCLAGYYCAAGNTCRSQADVIARSVGNAYIVEIASQQWTLPPGFAVAVERDVPDRQIAPVFAFQIVAADARSMTFTALLGTAKDGVQDPRNRTYLLAGTLVDQGSAGIAFSLGPTDIQSIIFGPTTNTLATFYQFTLTGRFAAEASRVEDGTLATVAKASEIYNLFYLSSSTSGQQLCDQFATYADYQCQPCPSAPTLTLCLAFAADTLAFPVVPGLGLDAIDDFDGEYI
jgi:hypothetical protein